MDVGLGASPTLLGVIAILISVSGTVLGLYAQSRKDKRTAHKEDLDSALDRIDLLERKLESREKIVDEQAQIIRDLRDQLAERDRTIKAQADEITTLKRRVSKLENKK